MYAHYIKSLKPATLLYLPGYWYVMGFDGRSRQHLSKHSAASNFCKQNKLPEFNNCIKLQRVAPPSPITGGWG